MFTTENRRRLSTRPYARPMSLLLAAGAAVSASLLGGQAQAQYVWIGSTTGTFSDSTKWLGGLVPPTGSAATTLTFSPGIIVAGVNATQNIAAQLPTPFMVNAMTFNNMSVASNFLVGNNPSSSNVFEFNVSGGSPATMTMQGYGLSQTSSGIAGAQMRLAADLRITGSGMGNLTLNNPIFEDGTPRRITVANTPATQITGIFTLASTGTVGSPALTTTGNTFSGGLVLDGGNLGWAGGGPGEFGISTFQVTSNGGTLFVNGNNSTNGARFTTMQLDGNLRVVGTSSGAFNLLTPAGELAVPVLAGSGNLLISGQTANTMNIGTDSSAYTGVVTLDRYDFGQVTATSGGLQLTTANGNLRGVSTFNIRNGGILNPTNILSNQAANSDRIANTAAINLASGTLRLVGTGTQSGAVNQVVLTEVVGAINGAGFSTLTAESSAGALYSATINTGAFSRVDRGTFLFRGLSLGAGTLLPNAVPNPDSTLNFDGAALTGYIVLPATVGGDLVGGGGAAGTNNISILPYAVGDTTNTAAGTTFVTLDAIAGAPSKVSVRPLAAAEYATDLVSGATTNARLTAATANAGVETVNSLVLATSAGVDGSVTGPGTLNVTCGAILAAQTVGVTNISNNIAFGAVEGKVFTPGFNGLTITGNMTGSGGLTKSGGGLNNNTLFLRGDNSGLTGQLTLNAGPIDFNPAAALPGTGTIVANGAAVGTTGAATGLHYTGTMPYTLVRDVAANTGWMTFKALDTTAGGGNLTLAGQISGNAGINLQATANGAEISIAPASGSNTYTGPTRMSSGIFHFGSDAHLGSGGAISVEAAQVVLEGDWTTSRIINNGGATINTNGYNAALNGPMINFNSSLGIFVNAAFTKTGAGTLSLNSNASNLGGPFSVTGGTLLVNGTVPLSTNAVTVGTGATLGGSGTIWRNITINSGATLAPGSSPGVLTQYGNLTLASGSTFAAELNGNTPGAYDRAAVNGTVALTDAALAPSLGYTPNYFDVLFIITNDGTEAVTGTFAGLAEGATVALGNVNAAPYSARISYVGDSATGATSGGNDVVLYNPGPVCPADFNDSGTVSVQDIFDFLAAYFAGNPRADFNHSTTISVQDIFDFLAAYFAGCP